MRHLMFNSLLRVDFPFCHHMQPEHAQKRLQGNLECMNVGPYIGHMQVLHRPYVGHTKAVHKPCTAYSTGHRWTIPNIQKLGGDGEAAAPPFSSYSLWSICGLYCRLYMAYVQISGIYGHIWTIYAHMVHIWPYMVIYMAILSYMVIYKSRMSELQLLETFKHLS